jgi:SAM-dependent methyltransferase
VVGRLYGLKPVPVENARVLEIGCGDGLNLIASAIVLPGARFHGIDLSTTAIQRGRRMVRELGLKNVRLEARDVRSLVGGRGRYHYVIAHGVYSWVPPDVRDALLAAIRNALTANGIAFVSYSVYPGAYLRQMVREMAVIFGGRRVEGAREWLNEAAGLQSGPAVYRAVLADEAADMLRRDDGALFHDDLSEVNQPCYFGDFVEHAGKNGLRYVAEALPDAVTGDDRVSAGQYADFQTGRRFRQSLLCRSGADVSREPDCSALKHCFVGGPIGRIGAGSVAHRNAEGERKLLDLLATAWPAYVPVDGFERGVSRLFMAGVVDVRTLPPPVATARRNPRPKASPLARLQAENGAGVTSLHHIEVIPGSDSLRAVLILADGTRTRAALIRDLRKLYPDNTKEQVASAVDQHLIELGQYGLLMG